MGRNCPRFKLTHYPERDELRSLCDEKVASERRPTLPILVLGRCRRFEAELIGKLADCRLQFRANHLNLDGILRFEHFGHERVDTIFR
jgi:hypothetical protein